MLETARHTIEVIGAPIDAMSWETALSRVVGWAEARESRYVCICNTHSVVTASRQADFHLAVKRADMAAADGAPVAWMMRRLGAPNQPRINGPDFMHSLCERASKQALPVYLFGSTDETLRLLQANLARQFPALLIAGAISPPFRPASPKETSAFLDAMNASGAAIIFVSLGCPKQELWMSAHSKSVHAVMIGVGAAFDFHAGGVRRAPQWMRRSGFEWLHRLLSEPRRLWKRYLVTNSLFMLFSARQLLRRSDSNRRF